MFGALEQDQEAEESEAWSISREQDFENHSKEACTWIWPWREWGLASGLCLPVACAKLPMEKCQALKASIHEEAFLHF